MPLIDASQTYQMTNPGAHIDATEVSAVHPNLLDNWYFVGGGSQLGDGVFPINQRGLTSYTTMGNSIDRWMLFGGSVVLASDGITVTSSPDFGQIFEPSRLPVGTYTASVLTAAGVLGSLTFTTTGSQFFAGGAMGNTGVTLNFIDLWAADKSLFSLQCAGVKIAAAKLEKGSVSTLANDVPPNFTEELMKCQHYLVVRNFKQYDVVGNGYAASATIGGFAFYLSSPLKNDGNITMTYTSLPSVYGHGAGSNLSSMSIASIQGNIVRFYMSFTGMTTNTAVCVMATADMTITISAEL